MILQRISKAFAGQDWYVVLLEVFIVVIGIFIGLRVDDWNEGRKERQQERIYLDKLARDLDAMRTELLRDVGGRRLRIERMKQALYALEDCDNSPRAQADVRFALERYQVSPGIDFLDATYNEMVSTGALARIPNQNLKQDIARAFSALAGLNERIVSFRASMPVVDSIVWQRVSYSIDPDSDHLAATFVFDQLCGDVELRNAFAEMVDIQVDGYGTALSTLPLVDQVMVRLDAMNGLESTHPPLETIALATRYAAAWSSQEPERLAAFYAVDGSLRVNDGAPSVGREAVEAKAAVFMSAYPDMVVRLDGLEQQGQVTKFHWHWIGTNTGPGGNGHRIDIRGHEEWTFDEDGLIVSSLGHYDAAEFKRQATKNRVLNR